MAEKSKTEPLFDAGKRYDVQLAFTVKFGQRYLRPDQKHTFEGSLLTKIASDNPGAIADAFEIT